MNKSLKTVVAALAFVAASSAVAQVTSTSTGGAGGSGGSAAGGTANGGTSTSTNTTTGTSSATGGTANIGAATSNVQGSEVSVNYTTPAGAAGVNGLAPGVDPNSNHIVSDNNVHYSGTTKIKNTPDVNLGGPASGPCNGLSGGVGVGIPGLAVGGNISTVDKACEARETARVAAMLGRVDIANAILENMDVVVIALNARTDREARASADAKNAVAQAKNAAVANAAIDQAVRDRDAGDIRQAARDRESDAMRLQQVAGVDALARQATMAKVNDTLSFTGKLTQGEERTPQQVMVDDLAARQAADRQTAELAAQQAAAQMIAAQKAATERAAAEKIALEKRAVDQLAADRTAAAKIAADKAAAAKDAADRIAFDQRAAEAARKLAVEEAAANRLVADAAEQQRVSDAKAAARKAAAARQEASTNAVALQATSVRTKDARKSTSDDAGDAVRAALGLGN